MKPRRRPTKAEQKAQAAAELAQRNVLIARLVTGGESVADIATLTDLSHQHIYRILEAAPPAPSAETPEDGLLTAVEVRDLRRENRFSPEALEWLAYQRTDRRHNGHSYQADALDSAEPLDSIDLDPEPAEAPHPASDPPSRPVAPTPVSDPRRRGPYTP